ncbi:MAG: exodeoxyribonuclease V subunit alpha [Pontibacterium sp.]
MSALLSRLKSLVECGELRALDYQFGRFLYDQGASDSTVLAGALVSLGLAQGHVCLRLNRLPVLPEKWQPLLQDYPIDSLGQEAGLIGAGHEVTPLVLDNGRLYLYRYWAWELSVSQQLLACAAPVEVEYSTLKVQLDGLFKPDASETDWQKVAAAIAVQRRFSVISGGPGTGKTTTVTKLLALIAKQYSGAGKIPVIKLAAPTGKAAARLSESIAGALGHLNLSESLRALIPSEASTLHRLLGVIPNSHSFRHNRSNPLHLDMLVVDEASMIDLPMMARLLEAMPESARLILIGDKDQLASVEAGSVLGDICQWPGEAGYSEAQAQALGRLCDLDARALTRNYSSPLADSVAQLHKSYRFHDQSGIGHLARAVNQGYYRQFEQVIATGYDDIEYQALDKACYETLINRTAQAYSIYLKQVAQGAEAGAVLSSFNRFQLLCALREGPFGVEGLNEVIRARLAKRGLVRADGQWYSGRPVMITRNDSVMALYNGDIGITLPDNEGNLKVWFEQSGQLRAVLPSRLPEHNTVYAMTVHKSQGSEFDQVLLLLPPQENPVVTRELLYTGITRAKKTLAVYATAPVLRQAIRQPTERHGGLAERLWQLWPSAL